ncbi:PREDICTED: BMP-binding endothelial regulator protein-like [Nicrophorus vespilloides]|uniref:BMP-binding endothelial regulator protein-like n=1 Tax=Nicrophorus vespilloides TaxID=110193 RepID=A0ABM1MJH4_NICVS|nr:PREDICTED: BMP-binding endothelial regulator protein-like [Nicrophorus vespilloides]
MERKASGWITVSTCFIIFSSLGFQDASALSVSGSKQSCTNEGVPIGVEYIDKHKCYSCICKNGYVVCNNNSCPNTDGCHLLVAKSKDECCEKCQGCYFNGTYHASGTEWTDPESPCVVMRCEAGVVTQSNLQCYVPCDNPLPPAKGKCCSTCPDCRINGQIATDDRDVTSDDPCVKCRCSGGKMTCSKKACPVLQCVKDEQEPGECCPRCRGVKSHYQSSHFCVLAKKMYKEGDYKKIDRCTECNCINQTSICVRQSCPILNCTADMQKKRPDSCCYECMIPETFEWTTKCVINGNVYQNGQSWRLDACSSCKCNNGMPSCARTRCNVTEPCPYGTHLVHAKGDCCPKCQEKEGVCRAFGDPHYKSFDGKIFTFRGLGKYQLTSDCQNHTFSIRVTNDFSSTNRSSTLTKRVRIKYGKTRINLGQKYRIRLDGYSVSTPYKGSGVLIEKEQYHLVVTLSNDVKILWNGQSFLEVTVPTVFKSKLCGLCGNFNLNVQDDLKMRKGGVTKDVSQFGHSWCVGKDCTRMQKKSLQMRSCRGRSHERNSCELLKTSRTFNGCVSKLNYVKYHEACMMDMCDCPNDRCYCDSLMAYAQECQRLGVDVSGWHRNSHCVGSATTSLTPSVHHKHPKPKMPKYNKAAILKLQRLSNTKKKGQEPPIN